MNVCSNLMQLNTKIFMTDKIGKYEYMQRYYYSHSLSLFVLKIAFMERRKRRETSDTS